MDNGNWKTAIISCYFGELTEYFSLFLQSIEWNKKIDWYLFLDNIDGIRKLEYDNIFIKKFTLSDFNRLATRKLGFNINIKNPYKLCDFKPAYGLIFEEILGKYSYWGYSDIDVIYGDVLKFLTLYKINQFDIISFYPSFFSGPFALFRNISLINRLFISVKDVKKIFMEPEKYYGLDENIFVKRSLVKRIRYLPLYLKNLNKISGNLRYNFQWYLKKKEVSKSKIIHDITEAIWYFSKEKRISYSFLDLIRSDRDYERKRKKNWLMLWENGRLFDKNNNQEIMSFHMIDLKKKNINWQSADFKERFYLDQNGIYPYL